MTPTRNSNRPNPKLAQGSNPEGARIGLRKDNVKEKNLETNVNVEIETLNPKLPTTLTLREEDLVEEIVQRFRDEKSRGNYRHIVGTLGVDLAYRAMLITWEVRDSIAVSPGAYFVGTAKNIARENGIDLGLGPSRHDGLAPRA